MDWSWCSAELATMVTGPHSLHFHVWSYKKNMVYESKIYIREELLVHHQIVDAARSINNPDVLRYVQIIFSFKYP
jgi:hypothetical protein